MPFNRTGPWMKAKIHKRVHLFVRGHRSLFPRTCIHVILSQPRVKLLTRLPAKLSNLHAWVETKIESSIRSHVFFSNLTWFRFRINFWAELQINNKILCIWSLQNGPHQKQSLYACRSLCKHILLYQSLSLIQHSIETIETNLWIESSISNCVWLWCIQRTYNKRKHTIGPQFANILGLKNVYKSSGSCYNNKRKQKRGTVGGPWLVYTINKCAWINEYVLTVLGLVDMKSIYSSCVFLRRY